MLKVAVPNKGTLAAPSAEMLQEAGYRQRSDSRDLTVLDTDNGVEFFFLRPKDIATYVGSGELDLGITGRDLALDSRAPVREVAGLGFGYSTFRFAAPADKEWTVDRLADARIASAYPSLVCDYLSARGIDTTVTRLDGAVEISIQLGLADVIADVVGSGRTLRQHGLVPFGDVICDSEAALIARDHGAELPATAVQVANRLRGVVVGQQYVMVEYNCPRTLLAEATQVTPGLDSPTLSPLADDAWVAVRAMVLRKRVNPVMDRLAELGATSILAYDMRSCRI